MSVVTACCPTPGTEGQIEIVPPQGQGHGLCTLNGWVKSTRCKHLFDDYIPSVCALQMVSGVNEERCALTCRHSWLLKWEVTAQNCDSVVGSHLCHPRCQLGVSYPELHILAYPA